MELIAKKGFRYGGRSLVAGDKFEASAKDARLLKAIKKAVEASEVTPNEARAEVELEPIEPVKAKAKYRTRRMKAEDEVTDGVNADEATDVESEDESAYATTEE